MRWAATVALAVVSCAIGACGGQGARGEGSIAGGPPPPPPPVDPRAGPPALLASVGERAVVLDAAGRVQHLLPAALGPTTRPCPGGRRLVDAPEFSGRVEVRTLAGRARWRRRIPIAYVQGIACLDPQARRVAVVLGSDRVKSLHIVSRRADRRLQRFRGEVPRLTATGMYVTDERGVRTYALPSGRAAGSLEGPAYVHLVAPSPDGRHFALATFDTPVDDYFLADAATGTVRPIDIPDVELIGWLAHDRLAVRTRRELLILDPAQQVHQSLPGFRADQAIVAGSGLLVVDARALSVLKLGASSPQRAGTVPRDTWLIAPLR